MRRSVTSTAALAVCAGLLLCSTALANEKSDSDLYSAVWALVGGGAGGSTVSIDIYINRYNTDEDIKNYAALLMDNGPDGLRRRLEKEDLGQLSPVGRIGTPIAIARRLQKGDKTIVRVVTARNLSFVELRYSG